MWDAEMMPEGHPLLSNEEAATLAGLAHELQRMQGGGDETADVIIDRVIEMVPDADWASLTVRAKRSTLITLASSTPEASQLDQLQYQWGEGPCVDAADETPWYRSGSVGEDPRWPTWGPKARAMGVGSLLSVRLLTTEETSLGAINMYSRREGCFHERDEVDFAVLVGVHAAAALASSLEIGGLQNALASRHTIGLAQGMLMERYGLGVDASFALLRRYSSTTNTKLTAVAEQIVETREFPPDPDLDPLPAQPS